MTRAGGLLLLAAAASAAAAGGYLLVRPRPTAPPAAASSPPGSPPEWSSGTGAARPGDPLPRRLGPLAEQINAKFGRVAPAALPWIVDNPSPQEMETFLAAARANVSGDPRRAETILRGAIASEKDEAVRDKFTLRLCDVLLVEGTAESRREARETLMKLGREALYFDMQVNVMVYLRRLESDLAREAARDAGAPGR